MVIYEKENNFLLYKVIKADEMEKKIDRWNYSSKHPVFEYRSDFEIVDTIF